MCSERGVFLHKRGVFLHIVRVKLGRGGEGFFTTGYICCSGSIQMQNIHLYIQSRGMRQGGGGSNAEIIKTTVTKYNTYLLQSTYKVAVYLEQAIDLWDP